MIGKCLLLQSIMDITLKPDGNAIYTPSTSIVQVRVRLEQAIGCFNKCRYRNKDKNVMTEE